MKKIVFLILISIVVACDFEKAEFKIKEIIDSEPVTNMPEEVKTFSDACELLKDQNSTLNEIIKKGTNNCKKIKTKKFESLLSTYYFSQKLEEIKTNNESSKCKKIHKATLKKYYQITQRKKNKLYTENEILQEKNRIAKVQLDRFLRNLTRLKCTSEALNDLYISPDDDTLFQLDDNLILNSSFDFINDKGIKPLEKSWQLFDAKNVPGWKVKAYANENKDINCSFLEIVKSAEPLNGKSYIELDAHCIDSEGKGVTGNALIEINQSFSITEAGNYKITMSAKKRDGKYGKLEYSIYSKKKDKSFIHHALPDENNWFDVCYETYISDLKRKVTVSIRDGGDDRPTYGLLIDNIKFTKGSCSEMPE